MALRPVFLGRLLRAPGRRRSALAFALGALGALALPPFFLLPLLIPAFSGLYVLIRTAPRVGRAFWDGWWFGFGYFVTGLYWICLSLFVEPERFAWLLPFALFGLPAVFAFYAAFAAWVTHRFPLKGAAGVLVFVNAWAVAEYLRSHLLTGFPWNLAGYAWTVSAVTMQPAATLGIHGLTWLTVLAAAVPALWRELPARRAGAIVLGVWTALAVTMGAGTWRLRAAEALPEEARFAPLVRLRIVQANVEQHHKWDPALQLDGLKRHIRLSLSDGGGITHVIWPETAVPFTLGSEREEEILSLLRHAVPLGGALITGVMRSERKGGQWRIWNSVVAVDTEGRVLSVYDKRKLVPFGEFVPLRRLLPEWVMPVGTTDFSRGGEARTMELSGLPPVRPLICYEGIFPEGVLPARGIRPRWLLNVTNDAWFGDSSGPYQHFQMERMRAVEQGLPLVRAANTGISGVVDAYGRVLVALELGKEGVLDSLLPLPSETITPYARYGDYFLLFLVYGSLVAAIFIVRR